METPWVLMKCVAKAVLNAVGAGFLGEVLIEVLPEVARDAWDAWSIARDEAQRRAEVEAVAQATPAAVTLAVAEVVEEVAADRSEADRQALATYLKQLPASIRRTLRRPADPSGATAPAGLALRRADDLLPMLPATLPRFQPGDRPLPGVDWELVELLGIGGFGEVWKARNPHFDGVPPAALKFCLDPAARDRLLRHEATLLNQVMRQGEHPGIVTLQHTYLGADPPCLEYEYVEGGDLGGLLREQASPGAGLAPAQATEVVLHLAEIIGFAHRLQPAIVHRDLKPANVLLRRGSNGVLALHVADFGIGGVAASRAIEKTRLTAGQPPLLVTALRGAHSPLYASPQQVRGEPPDPRDDVHAIGVIWYQLLMGNLALGRPGGTRWPKRLSEQGVPAAAIELLGACFEDDPADRPDDAQVLAGELKPLLGRSISIAVPSAPPPQPLSAPGAPRLSEVRRFEGHGSYVESVAFSPDGREAFAASADQSLLQWDLAEGRQLRRFVGHRGWVWCVRVSPDGQRILSCSDDQTARLWDVGTDKELQRFEGHQGKVLAGAFTPGGREVLTGGEDGLLRLWSVETGQEVQRFEGSASVLHAVGFSAGLNPVACGADGCICQWHADTGALLCRLQASPSALHGAAVAPGGGRVLAGGRDGLLHLWDLANPRELRCLKGHENQVTDVAFSPDGRLAVSGSMDRTVRLWDLESGRELCRFDGHTGSVYGVAFSPDGRQVLSGSRDRTVRLWDVPTIGH
jgi:serine/threonine protein kinase